MATGAPDPETRRERRATSALLAVLSAVREFGHPRRNTATGDLIEEAGFEPLEAGDADRGDNDAIEATLAVAEAAIRQPLEPTGHAESDDEEITWSGAEDGATPSRRPGDTDRSA